MWVVVVVACWRVVLVLVRDIHVIAPILIQTTNSPTTTHTHTHTLHNTHKRSFHHCPHQHVVCSNTTSIRSTTIG